MGRIEKIKVFDNIDFTIEYQESFIYSRRHISSFEVLPIKKIFGIICDIGDSSVHSLGIPNELISKVDMSLNTPSVIYKEDQSIVYYSPYNYDTKENVLNIIKLFNKLSTPITIYCSKNICNSVNIFSNDNIKIIPYSHPSEIKIIASIIISFGYCIRAFIKQNIPTIIIGSHGLGGWVTPDNLNYLLKDNFKGRPSGFNNENIPSGILIDEFVEIKEANNLEEILHENTLLLLEYEESIYIDNEDNFIKRQNKIYEYLIDTNKRLNLIPMLASNVQLIKNGKHTIIQRKEINDFLFSLPESDLDFLEDLNNGISCKNLKEKHEMDEDEFWEIMISLWERKAIIFKNEVQRK